MLFGLFSKKDEPNFHYNYDPEKERPVIRASICTGEQVAGFKDRKTGHFTEVLLIRYSSDIDLFKKTYGIDHVEKEY